MDYVKNQKEAIDIVKQMVADGQVAQDIAEKYFPELKESEDESIIRDIRVVLESSATRIFKENGQMPVWYDRAIAWLEKQGEQKPYGQRQECADCQFNYAGDCKGSCAMKRDEQKPADKVEPKFKVGDHIKPIDKCLGSSRIIEEIYDGWYVTDKGTLYFEFEDNWELVEKNPAWSEEDEQYIIDTLNLLSFSCSIHSISEVQDFLLSLKDRYTWKPSDEQMERLKGTINSLPHQEVLYSLYQDLKKLREK